jgi:peptide/nickel transport system substrate-binding protein
MQEQEIRALIEDVREGKLPRRGFIQQMVGLGLTAPMASMMLMHEGIAQTAPAIRTSPAAPKSRTPRASSTSRWPAGTVKAT